MAAVAATVSRRRCGVCTTARLNPARLPSTAHAIHLRRALLQVFRQAKNGPSFLSRVKTELGIHISVVPQAVEGQLGYLTAVSQVKASQGAVGRAQRRGCASLLPAQLPTAESTTHLC